MRLSSRVDQLQTLPHCGSRMFGVRQQAGHHVDDHLEPWSDSLMARRSKQQESWCCGRSTASGRRCCQTGNNIVFVGDCYYSRLRHCHWVSWWPVVLMKATRLPELDCSRRRRAIVTSCRCTVCWRLRRPESAIPQKLAGAVRSAEQRKTSLARCCARGAVVSVDGWHFFSPEILILQW